MEVGGPCTTEEVDIMENIGKYSYCPSSNSLHLEAEISQFYF